MKVNVIVSGGVIQDVYSDEPIEFNVIDYDCDSCDDSDLVHDENLHKTKTGNFLRVFQIPVFKNEFMDEETEELFDLLKE